MPDKDTPKNLEEFQEQLQRLFRNSNISMVLQNSKNEKPSRTENIKDTAEDKAQKETLHRIRKFNLKPREIRDYLNRFIIQQDEPKKVLSVAICDHYNHVRRCLENPETLNREYSKQNILLLGPTGVGKTYLMRTVARMIGVPFVKADATKFSETGYVGGDVEDLVRDLVKIANGNTELAQYGIIYIDEIDKIASIAPDNVRDISGRGVQTNLLKLMEDTEVNLLNPTDIMSQMQAMMTQMARSAAEPPPKKTLNTRHILFIVSGAFDKLAENVKSRLDKGHMGFNATKSADDATTPSSSNYLRRAKTRDFINYGFEPEFIGRLPVRVACDPLSAADLVAILTSSEGSILHQYRDDFRGYNIEFTITPEALQTIAEHGYEEKTGARGLMTVLEHLFREYKFQLPSSGITTFEITSETVANPTQQLKELLLENQHLKKSVLKNDLQRFADGFKSDYHFTLKFDDEATGLLIQKALENDKTLRFICEETFKDFQYGLKIIARNTGQKTFTITAAVVKNADKELSQWVIDSFQNSKKAPTSSASHSSLTQSGKAPS